MDADPRSSGRRTFGIFDLDLRTGELRKRGARVRLQQQPFQVLAMLVEHPGEVIGREICSARCGPRTPSSTSTTG